MATGVQNSTSKPGKCWLLNPNEDTVLVDEDRSGQRVDNFLIRHLRKLPRDMIYRLVREGKISVNGKRVKVWYKLRNLDNIRIPTILRSRNHSRKENVHDTRRSEDLRGSILYEDRYLMILNKPSGVAVHGGSGIRMGVIELIRSSSPRRHFELVHRLDKETSGILLISKKYSVLRALHEDFRENRIRKSYLTLTKGSWNLPDNLVVDLPVATRMSRKGRRYTSVDFSGKISETIFRLRENLRFASLLEVIPVTGRTHQIRVHASHAGYPIALDDRYGDFDFNRKLRSLGLGRLFLHASTIEFVHPGNNSVLKVTAPMDSELRKFLHLLRRNFGPNQTIRSEVHPTDVTDILPGTPSS